MMASRLINDRSRRHQSRWSITSNAASRNPVLDSTPRAALSLSPALQPAMAPSRLHLKFPANKLLPMHRATLPRFQAVVKSP